MRMKRQYIYQIYYDDVTRGGIDPQFLPLDNVRNERPDWREYWPMRNFLLNNALDEDAHYGFFSPKFGLKTGLSGKTVAEFIDANDADVYLFTPFVEQASFFLNPFEHGEANHPGLMAAAQQFVAALGVQVDLRMLVCDYNTTVYSNYFVARPAFWRKWLQWGESLFAMAEAGEAPLSAALNATADYHQQVGAVAQKVFIMERLVTLVLLFNQFSTKAFDPFAITRCGISASYLDHEMRVANALKMAFLNTRDNRYVESFMQFRNAVMASLR